MKIEINVTGLDPLVSVLERIACLVPAPATLQPVAVPVAAAPAPQMTATVPAQPIAAAPISMPEPAQAMAAAHAPAQPPVMGAAVPVTAQTYAMEQLAVAATQLVDAGRRQELVNLLAAFGVQALTDLPKEQYGNFATQLRAMGAKL